MEQENRHVEGRDSRQHQIQGYKINVYIVHERTHPPACPACPGCPSVPGFPGFPAGPAGPGGPAGPCPPPFP